MNKRVCIVMPAYNEAANLRVLLPLILREAENIPTHELHIVVVDDSSPDGTASVVSEWALQDPRIHLLSGEKKAGLGEAYKRGIAYALASLKPELIIQMDADLQHDPALLPLFVSLPQYGFTLVIGSRFAAGAGKPALSLRRRLISRMGTILVRMAAGLPPLTDCTSGYRCINSDELARCDLQSLATRGYSFQSSLLSELIRNGARVVEIPIIFRPRATGLSKLGWDDQIEFLSNLGRLCLRRMQRAGVRGASSDAFASQHVDTLGEDLIREAPESEDLAREANK
jgi:dolichol-phosphate mannosyltransferase